MIGAALLSAPVTNGTGLPRFRVWQRQSGEVVFAFDNDSPSAFDVALELEPLGPRELHVYEVDDDELDDVFVVAARRRFAWRIYIKPGPASAGGLLVGNTYLRLPIPGVDDDPVPTWRELAREMLH